MRILIVLVLLLLAAAICDFYRGKIPNILIVAGCCYGMVRLLYHQEILRALPGIIVPVMVLFPLYKIGTIGAGDIKLLSMLGFYFNFMETLFCIFLTFMLGAMFSVISFIRYKNFWERMTYLFSYLKKCFDTGCLQYYYLDSKEKQISYSAESKSKIHLAIPIFFSVLLHLGGVFG